MKRTIVAIALTLTVLALFTACDPLINPHALVGTWLRADGNERWIFRNDETFDNDVYSGGAWSTFMSGTYVYTPTPAELTVTQSSSTFSMALLVSDTVDRMTQGLDALSGGDTASLIGTWEGYLITTSSSTLTNRWEFTNSTVSHTNSAGNSGSGSVAINASAKTFNVSSSTNTNSAVLPDGTYMYKVIGDGITIAEPGDTPLYFDKQ